MMLIGRAYMDVVDTNAGRWKSAWFFAIWTGEAVIFLLFSCLWEGRMASCMSSLAGWFLFNTVALVLVGGLPPAASFTLSHLAFYIKGGAYLAFYIMIMTR